MIYGGYAVRKDGQGWRSVDGSEADPENKDWIYPDYETEEFSQDTPPIPIASPEEILAAANSHRDMLLTFATLRVNPLQDAVDLEEATEADIASLKNWKKYRVLVNRVTDQATYPHTIVWPPQPSE